jgi:hypothetical protein
MSVAQMCDNGLKCIFDKDKATVVDANMNPKFVFKRSGGLYNTPMKLKAPAPFQRQDA